MRRIIQLLSLIFWSISGYGWIAPLDSVEYIDEKAAYLDSVVAKGDIHHAVMLAWKMAQATMFDDLEEAKDLASRGVDAAKSIQFGAGLSRCYQVLGTTHEMQGYPAEGRNFYELAYEQALLLDSLHAIEIRHQIASSFLLEGNRGRAMQHFANALHLARKVNDGHLVSETLKKIASIYEQQGKLDEALTFYREVLELSHYEGNHSAMATAYQKIGLILRDQAKTEPSAIALRKAVDYFHRLNLEEEAIETTLELAETLVQLSEYEEAKTLIEEPYATVQIYLPFVQARLHLIWGRIALAAGHLDTAKSSLETGFAMIEDTNRERQKSDFLAALIEYYEQQGDYEKAFYFSQRNAEIKDTLHQMRSIIVEEEAATRLAVQEKENELTIALQQKDRSERERNWLAALLGVLILLLIATASYASLKNRSNRELSSKNALIKRNLREKEILLREIHHRVKNNLQLVSSMLNMQARSTPEKEGSKALREGKDRIRSMALIHRDLYEAENLEGVNTAKYIGRLCKSLISSYQQHHTKKVNLKTDIDDVRLDIDTIIPIGLILNELISNALKYAFSAEAGNPVIYVRLKKLADQVSLIVQDNGVGISLLDLKFNQSMGFKLIDAFSKKLGGSFHTTNDGGARIELTFRVPEVVSA